MRTSTLLSSLSLRAAGTFVLAFFAALSVRAQTTANGDLAVQFFQTGDATDSTAIIGGEKGEPTAILSDVRMDGKVLFVNIIGTGTATTTTGTPCATAIMDAKHGANLLFSGTTWTNERSGAMAGDGMVTFLGNNTSDMMAVTPTGTGGLSQSITTGTGVLGAANFPGIQMNNPAGVRIQGQKGIRVDKKAIFFTGKLHLSSDTLTFGREAVVTCDDKNSYIQMASLRATSGNDGGGSALVAKDTATKATDVRMSFRFPIGSAESYSPMTVVLKKATAGATGTTAGTTHKIMARFDNNIPIIENIAFPNQARYDKGGSSFWTVKTNIPSSAGTGSSGTGQFITPDSVYLDIENTFAQNENLVSSNFRRSRAFVTQYIDPATRTSTAATVVEGSNWDRPSNLQDQDLRPTVLTVSKAGSRTTLLRYKREGSGTHLMVDNSADNKFSFYAVANYDHQPLATRFQMAKVEYDAILCAVHAQWEFLDKFTGQEYFIELSTDSMQTGQRFRVNDNLAAVENNSKYTYNLFANQLPPNSFSASTPLFARIVERDFGGETKSYATGPFMLSCSTEDVSEKQPLISAISSGAGGQMIVQYDATYAEELEFSIWNITGQKELDLGHRSIHAGRNQVVFNLPVSITRNQRYILLITGGVLNQAVKTSTVTFTVK